MTHRDRLFIGQRSGGGAPRPTSSTGAVSASCARPHPTPGRGLAHVRPAWCVILATTTAMLAFGCAHEVVWKGEEGPRFGAPPEPLGITVGLGVQSFTADRVTEPGVLSRMSDDLRDARLFQAVLYPIPADVTPVWEVKLLVRDEVNEAGANFWKSALARAILPLAFVIWFDTDYTLKMEALLTRRGEIIGSYAAESPIRYRFQSNTNVPQMEQEGLELALRRASSAILAAMARDAARIDEASRERAGT